MSKKLVFVPTYNDHHHLDEIIEYILGLGEEFLILIVDDGSVTPINVNSNSSRVFVFRIPFNAGIGLGLNIALDLGARLGVDALVRIDSDGQHPLTSVLPLLEKLEIDNNDFVLGCRTNADEMGGRFSALRVFSKRYMNFIIRRFIGIPILDVHTGFFALNRSGIEKLRATPFTRYPEVQVLLQAKENNLNISSIEIVSQLRLFNESSIKIFQGLLIFLRFHIHILEYVIKRLV